MNLFHPKTELRKSLAICFGCSFVFLVATACGGSENCEKSNEKPVSSPIALGTQLPNPKTDSTPLPESVKKCLSGKLQEASALEKSLALSPAALTSNLLSCDANLSTAEIESLSSQIEVSQGARGELLTLVKSQ